MGRDLPSGTVTFLFTDVEGSTRLLEELGAEGYAAANEGHRQAVRDALARHGGVEVSTHGDAFFAVFTDPAAGVRAAVDAQELLADGRLRVRMGLHSGMAVIADDTYVGMDVNRAARIADAAHGGQVLVSPEVRAALDEAFALTDLGEQRLKDLGQPVRLFQLGSARFPPLRVLHRSNLPVPATPFIGREAELAEIASLLSREGTRLVTLTGPGGSGKTRLALQAAAEAAGRFPDGLVWIPLAPLREPGLVLATVAEAMSVKEQAGTSTLESLTESLAGKRALLLLDNAEHLMPAIARDVAALGAAAPTLCFVVTSRERLRVTGEQVYAVPPLEEDDGVSLFLARARAIAPGLAAGPVITELCERLEQLPLALELAAARVGLLSPEQLLDRIGGRLDVLKGGIDADPRQRTLRATIEWSHDLLSPTEQEAFACVSFFAGGCTLDAAETVCESDLDTLQSLLDKSLIRRRDTDGGPRLWMLETIREFAAEQLDASRADDVARRHLDYYLGLAREVSERAEQGRYDLGQIDEERDNLRIALDTALATDPDRALDLAGCLGPYWGVRGQYREGRERLATALAAAPGAPASTRAVALRHAGSLARWQSDYGAAVELVQQALALDRERDDPQSVSRDLNVLGVVASYRGDYAEAERLLEESLAHDRLAGGSRLPDAVFNLISVANARGDHARAIELARGLVAEGTRDGHSRGVAYALNELGLSLEASGEVEEARQSFVESIAVCRTHGYPETLAYALASLAHLEVATRPASALEHYRESLDLMRELGEQRGIAYCLEGIAATVRGSDPRRAAMLLGAAAAIRERTHAVLAPEEATEVDATITDVEQALGAERSRAEWSAGAGMALDDVIESALAPTAPD